MKPVTTQLNSLSAQAGLRTWVEIDPEAVAHNYRVITARLQPGTKFMAVVKSNAYGHDLIGFAKLLEQLGADWLGVDSILEAVALREEDIKTPILVLGYTLPEKFSDATKHQISLTISSFEHLENLDDHNFKFHLKIDTGMHRQGFSPDDTPRLLEWLKSKKISTERVEGVYTHFAAAKNPAFPADTLAQLEKFKQTLAEFHEANFTPLAHAAATGGALLFPQTQLDLVRIGIGLYGLWPSKETRAALDSQLTLKPALAWKTIIGETKFIKAGEKIGYDLTESLPHDGRIGICPIGYWHGYPRLLSAVAPVIVAGQRTKVLGRISMDMIVIDLTTSHQTKIGDQVTLLGGAGAETVTADDLAELSQTTNYEIVTRLNPLMKRVFLTKPQT